MVKVLMMINNLVLISQIEEISADIGEPDCKLIKPFVVKTINHSVLLEPFLFEYTKQGIFKISSDKILTLAEPTPTLLEKYEDLIK